MLLCWLLVLVLTVLLLLDGIDRTGRKYQAVRKIPGPIVYPVVGTLVSSLGMNAANCFQVLRNWAMRYNGTYKNWVTSRLCIVNICRVREAEPLLSGSKNIDKGLFYTFLQHWLGTGLLSSTGAKWMHRRRILTPAFHFNILNGFHTVFRKECDKLIDIIEQHLRSGTDLELFPTMSSITLNSICETSMGVRLDETIGAEEYRKGIKAMGELILHRTLNPLLYPESIHRLFGYAKQWEKVVQPLRKFTAGIISQRRKQMVPRMRLFEGDIYSSIKQRYAMLDTLLAAEDNGQIDEAGIQEEVDTFTFEGHDTTASALVFVFLTMAWEGAVQEQVYDELKTLYDQKPPGEESFTQADFGRLRYFGRVLKECLRLWPPVPFISRGLTEDILLPDGELIPKGTIANIHIFDLHRDPAQFPDPERFDPDRFLPEAIEARNPYAYVPFSAGPRNCIGQKYAMLELWTILCHVLLRYRVLPVTQRHEVQFSAQMVLRASNPLKVQFARR